MIKELTCIQCPRGCRLKVHITKTGKAGQVEGYQCPKGEAYGRDEVENPLRTLTSTVTAYGLEVRMVPVRTSRPIPKGKLIAAMELIRRLQLSEPISCGQVLVKDFLLSGVDLVATRTVKRRDD